MTRKKKRPREGSEKGRQGSISSRPLPSEGSPAEDWLPERPDVHKFTNNDVQRVEEILLSGLPSTGKASSGYARLMIVPEGGSCHLTMREYRGRTQKPDSSLFIDCTNLHQVIRSETMPLVAVSLNGDEYGEWTSCVLGFLHPGLILLQPVFLIDNKTIDHVATAKLDPIPPINLMNGDYPDMIMIYLNACTDELVGADGRVKCSKDGPDMYRASDFPDLHRKSIEAGKLPQYQFSDNVQEMPEGETVLAGCVSASEINTDFEKLVKKLIAVERLDSRTGDGRSVFSYLEPKKAKCLVKKESVPRADFNSILDELESFHRHVRIHDVPKHGRVALVEAGGEVLVGKALSYEENIPPIQRSGRTFAEFCEKKNVSLQLDAFQFASSRTFKGTSITRPSSDSSLGTCCYSATRSTSATMSSPRMPPEEVRYFQLYNSKWNPTLLPWGMDRLVAISAMERKDADPDYERILQNAQKNAWRDMRDLAPRMSEDARGMIDDKPGHLNSLGIWTTFNDVCNFCIGSHFDKSDAFGYIISMMGMRDPSRTQLSLATTCGYSTTLEGGVGCSAYFHYDSICQAVAIPPNTVSYNTFRSSEVMHHTGVCYSYDDERVYLNPVHLRISAWGGSSSSDASYSGRRDFAAANLWAGGLVPARLTLRAYVERMLNRGQVTNAQNTAGAWDSATAAEENVQHA
ncbi:hypothetical protein THAOC_17299 [Thalassiosira oceanica]|uniref:Uncharacterized protein n=1 Tax=Thalassiosira oceanica TaxID=159749 RepID=K0SB00_THAOC|nr:hypothetical protein THAOC_17299 [Thalassiosira oceanica]|eukprot:EJK62104.1 hypothetical protein THAOC_17299 [Thalassiosira oceanica]